MEHLIEKLLFHFFNYAESYTFLFAWLVVPTGFYAVFLALKRNAQEIRPPSVDAVQTVSHDAPGIELPKREAQVNKNLANA